MARTPGSRNRDYDQKREQLLAALQLRLVQSDAVRLSLSEMAAAAGVNVSTLRHHLGGRDEILAAVLHRQGALGAPYLAMVRAEPTLPLEASLRITMQMMVQGLRFGLGSLLANGLTLSLRQPALGPVFLEAILEPLLQAVEARLAAHGRRGELAEADLRIAALTLVSPLVLAALHQDELCGSTVRPLSLPELADVQVTYFLRAYGVSSAAR